MGGRHKKSKKQSAGNKLSLSPPEEFVLYLDENLCNCTAIQECLDRLEVRFERHLSHFSRGTADEDWLPAVGKNGWVLLTADKQMRYNLLEKRALGNHKVREFVFASGNMSGADMAAAIEAALSKMKGLCAKQRAPFVAAITRTGAVHLRWPKPGLS